MPAVREDLLIPQGLSWMGPFWVLIGQQDEPVSLTGRTVHAQVRRSPDDPVVLHEWSTAAGNVLVTEATVTINDNGTVFDVTTVAIALTVKPSVSSAWTWRDGVYDVEVHNDADPEDVWSIMLTSRVEVDPEVTRDEVEVTP